jgi:LmbE family N-acetylglucosaminyl deacetylase
MPGDEVTVDLCAVRKSESIAAMGLLGVPRANLRFLDLPEAGLPRVTAALQRLLRERLDELRPDHVFAPFRYDRHPDHLAVNRAATQAYLDGAFTGTLTEYFVYHRWRLLPGGNIRRYIRAECLSSIDIGAVASRKRAALACFKSQTTRYFAWQTRPILTPELLDDECLGPELFLRYDAAWSGTRVFTGAVPWIRIAHRLEPKLQKWKYHVKATVSRAARRIRDSRRRR